MHKKKNSASVLAGEMILTFYKPKRVKKASPPAGNGPENDPAKILSEVFDVCLANGAKTFTSEALFNRLIMELWQRRALGCLSLNRQEFTSRLEQRGWSYDPKNHLWSSAEKHETGREELALFS